MLSNKELISLVDILRLENAEETEWLEFKANYLKDEDIGEYISALSNGAALRDRPFGYLIFGIDDKTHEVIGTTYDFKKHKHGNEDLENWINHMLSPNIPFTVYDVPYSAMHKVVLFEIPAAYIHPTSFMNKDYIRIGSYRQDLHKYPGVEKNLWEALNHRSYEIAPSYNQDLHFTEMLMVAKKRGVEFSEEKFNTLHMLDANGRFNNLALLLSDENPHVVKFAVYKDDSLNFSVKEEFTGSWLLMLDQAFKYVNLYNTTSATIGSELARKEIQSYPDPSLREMVVNAFGHLDLSFPSDIKIEFYKDRAEVSSPGSLYRTTMAEVLKGKQSYRNPNLIFVLSKFHYIENYATGIKRTNAAYVDSEEKPLYEASENFFTATLPNINYLMEKENLRGSTQAESKNSGDASVISACEQVSDPVEDKIRENIKLDARQLTDLLNFCTEPKSRQEMQDFCDIKSRSYFLNSILQALLDYGMIKRTIPDKPNSSKQKYVKV